MISSLCPQPGRKTEGVRDVSAEVAALSRIVSSSYRTCLQEESATYSGHEVGSTLEDSPAVSQKVQPSSMASRSTCLLSSSDFRSP